MLIMKMKACVARYRRSSIVQFCAKQCRSFIKRYENLNYDIGSNGEDRVLKKLTAFPFVQIFDVGANEGDWALRVSSYFPNATVHAFEIVPQTYQILHDQTLGHNNIIINNVGLSNDRKEVELKYFPENSTVTSVYNVHYPGSSITIKANVMRGDDYAALGRGFHIDLLKIDVEGAEHLVLDGFKDTLKNKRIEVIQFEYGKANILSRFLLADYYDLLRPLGYRIGKIYPTFVDFRDYDLDHEDFIGPNYLAVKEDRIDLIKALS
jgi:FkbM family methyltransferase